MEESSSRNIKQLFTIPLEYSIIYLPNLYYILGTVLGKEI